MYFWIGRPHAGHRQMLFATPGGRPSEVPHALVHVAHAGLFVRDNPSAYFACDRCGLAFRLRVEDGANPTEAEVRAALDSTSAEEVVARAAVSGRETSSEDRARLTYTSRAQSDRALEAGRLLDMIVAETPAIEGFDDE